MSRTGDISKGVTVAQVVSGITIKERPTHTQAEGDRHQFHFLLTSPGVGAADAMPSRVGVGEPVSTCRLLTVHRELLVQQLKNTQCVLDNLQGSGFFCTEDTELVLRAATKTDQVRKILELLQSKGEDACEYFLYILHKVCDTYIELHPWLKEIQYEPSALTQEIPVVNTDPISKYCEKLRHELGRDTRFIVSYSQKEETLLEDLYTDTLMELLSERNESLGYLDDLGQLLDDTGVFSPHAETILIIGDAGVGKSILLQKLQNLWSKRKLEVGAKFFFKFRCRMFGLFKETDKISLKDLLFKYNCYPDNDPDDEVFSYIQRFPDTVLFTFDGYDEIHMAFNLTDLPEVVSPEEKVHPLLLFMNLLSGKLLKGSWKIMTARTGTEIETRILRKKVFLKGFSPEQLRQYTVLHFQDREYQDLVTVQLEANPHLCSLCSIPLFCWIIFKSFKYFHAKYDDFELPNDGVTLTQVFLLLLEVFLGHFSRPGLLQRSNRCTAETFKAGQRALVAFAKLALLGMQKGGFIFSQDEVASCGILQDDLQIGFLRPVDHYNCCGSGATYEFLHVTLQSFMAAFCLILDEHTSSQRILEFFSECEYRKVSKISCTCCLRGNQSCTKDPFQANDHLQFTNIFLCGLLSKHNTVLMECLLPPSSLKKKRGVLKSYLSQTVKAQLRGLPRYTSDTEGNKVHVMPNFLWALRCIFELASDDVAKLAARGISADYIKLAYCNMFSADCSALNFVLHHHHKCLGVDMDNNNISDYGVKQLCPSFCKMTAVRLCVNQITDSGVEVLAEELVKYKVVQVLGLYKNHITDVGARLVAKIIEECPHLRIVKLGNNKITSVGGKYLASAIQKSRSIFDVGMWGNTIGDEGAKAFAQALRNHHSLTNLSLSANGITSEGGRSLAAALKENTSVHIFWLIDNHLTIKGAQHLAEALLHNSTLKEICMKGNLVSEEEQQQFAGEKRLRFC
ncbi:nucleotide-binding oligomerization domain-containing protein 1-like [Arapaima gigas]